MGHTGVNGNGRNNILNHSIPTKEGFVVKKTTSLCFNAKGLINPESINYLRNKGGDTIVMFGDGTEEALQQIKTFDISVFEGKVKQVGLGITPLYELRAISQNGQTSRPNYAYSEDVRVKWICSRICAPNFKIHISDHNSQTGTQMLMEPKQTEGICYNACRLWMLLRVVEDRLLFPALLMDRLLRFTYYLKPTTMNVEKLRKETGVQTLDYNPATDILSVEVGGDLFTIKMSVLDEIFGKLVLPHYNRIYGRRLRIRVAVKGSTGWTEPVDMTYGELGRIVEQMLMHAKEKKITHETPLDPRDLLAYAKKVKVDRETCVWVTGNTTVTEIADRLKDQFVRHRDDDHIANDNYPEGESDPDPIVPLPVGLPDGS